MRCSRAEHINDRYKVPKEVSKGATFTLIVHSSDMFFPSMTSWYIVVGDTSGTQANSERGVAVILSPISLWGARHRGSSDCGTAVELRSQRCSSRRWQSHSQ